MYFRRSAAVLALFALGGAVRGTVAEAAAGSPHTLERPARRTTELPAAQSAPQSAAELATPSWPARIDARLAALTPGPGPGPANTIDAAALQLAITELLAERAAARAQVAVHVRELAGGTALADKDGALPLNAASNHKLLTSIAALELLGAEYRFETRVLHDGDALVLVGDGDPSLLHEDLARLAESVRAQLELGTIRRIVIDDAMFSAERFGPGYDREGPGYSYMAPSGALSLQWNTVQISVEPGRPGQPPAVFVDPPCEHLRIDNLATTGRGAPLSVETAADGEHTVVRVRGSLSARAQVQTIRRRVQDPGRFTASVLATELGPELAALPIVRGHASAHATELARHRSAALPQLLGSALKFSNNFTTEQLLRTLGARASGSPGDWYNGTAVLRRFWRALGHDDAALVFENASGYSKIGRISARALVDLLAWSQRDGSRSAAVLAALPVSGTDGTLRDRLLDAEGRVLAKTGTLDGASALSGVITDAAGVPRIAFSVLVNGRMAGYQAHALQDRLVRLLLARV